MAKLSPEQVYADLIAAGFPPYSAMIETAIAGAESGYSDTSIGDVGLEDSTWGPSYGTYQVRTLKAQTGTGSDRDVNWLAASDTDQAKAAYDISRGGTDFTPWSTYTSGRYQDFLPQAQAAAGAGAAHTTAVTSQAGPGPWWLPWNLPGAIASNTLGGARSIVVEALAVAAGVGLLILGGVRLAAPHAVPVIQDRIDDAAKILPAVL